MVDGRNLFPYAYICDLKLGTHVVRGKVNLYIYLDTETTGNGPDDRLSWRERLVLLMDHYTPRYRWEHTQEEVQGWYKELGLIDVRVTEVRDWGFGMVGSRPRASASAGQ